LLVCGKGPFRSGGLTKIGRGNPDMVCHTIAGGFVISFDVHHGATLGVVTPRWMRYVVKDAPETFARFAKNIYGIDENDQVKTAEKGVEVYIQWLKQIGALGTFHDLTEAEITEDKLKLITRKTYAGRSGQVGRLKKLNEQDIFNILQASCSPL